MRLILHAALFTLLALGIGLGLTYFSIVEGRLFGAYQLGQWQTWPDAGSPTPDPYTKAFLARSSQLQLGRSEGVQFIAHEDSAGTPFSSACDYTFSGDTPVSAFWTLRADTLTGVNLAVPNEPQAMRSGRLARDDAGIATINISPRLQSGNWLQISDNGAFVLVLTFYDASFLSGISKSVSTLPIVTRGTCQ